MTAANPVRSLTASGTVELRDATFAYPGAEQPVLRNVSFTAKPGTTTAVIGSTGAGKTTLVNLLPRLFDATGGAVLVDGVDVRELEPELLWSAVRPRAAEGVPVRRHRRVEPAVRQPGGHRRGALARARDRPGEGLRLARCPRASTARSRRAAPTSRAASASGSRSRARSSSDPRSTSSTTRSRPSTPRPTQRLRAALKREVAGATLIVIAQRVSTIVDADLILVLEDGEIVGRGTHDELLVSNPTYAEIVESQLSAQEAA